MENTTLLLSPSEAKRLAGEYVVEKYVKNGYSLGVGTGETVGYLVKALAEKYQNKQLTDIICVPSSLSTRHLLIESGLPIVELEQGIILDICIDGVDEIDPQLNAIKGCGGCLMMEKVVQSCAKEFILIGDFNKLSLKLGEKVDKIPLEVVPVGYAPVRKRVAAEYGGQCIQRQAVYKAGPVITDYGNYLLDWYFPPERENNWKELHEKLKMTAGIIETGLFIGLANRACLGMPDGTVKEICSSH